MPHLSRREFSVRVSAAVAGGLAVNPAGAQEPPPPPEATADAPAEHEESPPLAPEDLQLALLLERYPGKHLTPEMLAGIRAGLASNRRVAERIRAVPLRFEVEPAFVFQARRFE